MPERKGEVKHFGAKCKTFAKAAKEARQKQQQAQEPVLTTEQKLDNIAKNTQAVLQEQSNAINAISMWIAKNDTKVAKAGNVLEWALKEQAKEQRLAERKSEYARTRKKSS